MSVMAAMGSWPNASQYWGVLKGGQSRVVMMPWVGHQVEGDAEDEDQHQAQPERRQRVEDVGEERHELVEQRVAVDGRVRSQQDRDADPQHQGGRGQDQRGRDRAR